MYDPEGMFGNEGTMKFWDNQRLSIVKALHPDQHEKGEEKESPKEIHAPVRNDLPVEAGWR